MTQLRLIEIENLKDEIAEAKKQLQQATSLDDIGYLEKLIDETQKRLEERQESIEKEMKAYEQFEQSLAPDAQDEVGEHKLTEELPRDSQNQDEVGEHKLTEELPRDSQNILDEIDKLKEQSEKAREAASGLSDTANKVDREFGIYKENHEHDVER
jgi:exonuclease VII large subunit